MSAIDTVRAFMAALETNEKESVANALSDNFLFSGWTPQPLDKKNFLIVMSGLKFGIPGLIFNLHNVEEQGNTVTGTIQTAGYQSNSFELPPLSLPVIPQMGRSISLPPEDVRYTVENNLITTWVVKHVEGGGIKGLLHQLGIDSPVIQ